MAFCNHCGHQTKEGLLYFCDKCGSRLSNQSNKVIETTPTVQVISQVEQPASFCGCCGHALLNNTKFCPTCGTAIGVRFTKTTPTVQDASQKEQITPEPYVNPGQEIYRRNLIGYYTGNILAPQISGLFVITTEKISFAAAGFPLVPLIWSKFKLNIEMGNVIYAECATIIGINSGIRIYTKDGKKFLFTVGITNNDQEKIVNVINQSISAIGEEMRT